MLRRLVAAGCCGCRSRCSPRWTPMPTAAPNSFLLAELDTLIAADHGAVTSMNECRQSHALPQWSVVRFCWLSSAGSGSSPMHGCLGVVLSCSTTPPPSPAQTALACWGSNGSGQATIPAGFSSGVASVAAGALHTCAVSVAGSLACWGLNDKGQTAIPTGFATGVASVASGPRSFHTCAILAAGGALACWGANGGGQTAVPAGFSSSVASVAVGGRHTCAITTSGSLACWGANGSGQTDIPAGFTTNVAAAAVGNFHTCAVNTSGSLK